EAWEAAAFEIEGRPPNLSSAVLRLRDTIEKERNPRLLALENAARSRGLTFLSDEDHASVGSGTGVMVWPVRSIPEPSTIDWTRVHDVPIALVTGSNGKTTVVRLLSAMIRKWGKVPGSTSTDGVYVDGATIEEGDFSGPGGARLVLRQREVETAVLETARGGLLRRGLATSRANVAAVTNIAEDHLGEFGVESLEQLAETKLLVARALVGGGSLVLNADDAVLVRASSKLTVPITWFSLDDASEIVKTHIERGGTAVVSAGENIVLLRGGERTPVVPTRDAPFTFGGTARHNVANALAAVAAALELGIPIEAIAEALRSFGKKPADNPGRANLYEVGGARILVDYAHNAHGMSALVGLAQRIPADRRLVMVGSAGDRQDEAIREMARAASSLPPDRVIVKDAEQYLRGRTLGEIPALLADEFTRLGTPVSSISSAMSELEGVRDALTWARPGDLLVLAVHQDRRQVLGLFDQLGSAGWKAGEPLPD
ncbi:MAG TPA: Mur ligase family protein, partial [Gemmatimonadales bacterium]|nr:Mur ligase family protein [Gemmatimonadales bacterium]